MNPDCYRAPQANQRKIALVASAPSSPYAMPVDPSRAVLSTWTGGTAPSETPAADPRLLAVIGENIAEGMGATLIAAEAVLGRPVTEAEVRRASKGVPLATLKASLKLTASIGRQ